MMDRKVTRVISDMRVTIPEAFREEYDLEEGDQVWIEIEPVGDGETKGWLVGD